MERGSKARLDENHTGNLGKRFCRLDAPRDSLGVRSRTFLLAEK